MSGDALNTSCRFTMSCRDPEVYSRVTLLRHTKYFLKGKVGKLCLRSVYDRGKRERQTDLSGSLLSHVLIHQSSLLGDTTALHRLVASFGSFATAQKATF